MALIIEDGTGAIDSNSYVTAGELDAYAADRGYELTLDPEELLTRAMDYVESQPFIGNKSTAEQALQWPRTGAYIDGFAVAADTIPNQLKQATLATALAISNGSDPSAEVEREVIKEKVGDLEVQYNPTGNQGVVPKTVTQAFKKLIRRGSGGVNFRVAL